MVGSEQTESSAGSLRDDKAIEWVVPGQLGKVADRLGVLGSDAE